MSQIYTWGKKNKKNKKFPQKLPNFLVEKAFKNISVRPGCPELVPTVARRSSVRPSPLLPAGRPSVHPSVRLSVRPGCPASVTPSPGPLRRPLRRLVFCVKVFVLLCLLCAGRSGVAGVLVAGKKEKEKQQQGICRWDFVVRNIMMSTNSLLSS